MLPSKYTIRFQNSNVQFAMINSRDMAKYCHLLEVKRQYTERCEQAWDFTQMD